MNTPGRTIRILAAIGMGATLLVAGTAGPATASATSAAAPAATSTLSVRQALLGTWVGTYSGFDSTTFTKGLERFTITVVRGATAKGTWQYRATAADPWSAKSPLLLVALPNPDGGWKVTGADENGIIVGTLDAAATTLDLAYQGSVNDLLAYHFVLTKK